MGWSGGSGEGAGWCGGSGAGAGRERVPTHSSAGPRVAHPSPRKLPLLAINARPNRAEISERSLEGGKVILEGAEGCRDWPWTEGWGSRACHVEARPDHNAPRRAPAAPSQRQAPGRQPAHPFTEAVH